jgi:hypothetical protein
MFARTHGDLHKIRDSVEAVKRLSDRIIGIGPINIIGIDGILAFLPIPGLSMAYSILAGLFLLIQGMRAKVSPVTLIVCFVILLIDSGITTVEEVIQLVPFAGPLIAFLPAIGDAFFQGHLYSAHLIQKEMDKTHYVMGSESAARQSGEHHEHLADMRGTKGKKRLVYLG